MKNNKGFTLVEIIVCIALISIIGVSSTIIVIKTKNKNNNVNILNGTKMSAKLSNITNKILQAANVYIAVEKDGNGNTYETGIKNGGKGLYIKVQTLVDNGYLDKSVLDNLKKETDKLTSELQLLAVDAVNKKDDKLCNNSNAIEYTVSWSNNNDKPIYLCPYDNVKGNENNIMSNKILKDNTINTKKVDTSKIAVSTEFKNTLSNEDKAKVTDEENGLFIDMDNDGATFYFRGAVENNYFQYGTYKNTNEPLLWRILRINGDGTLRLVLDDVINYSLLDYNSNKISRANDTYEVSRIYPAGDYSLMNTEIYIPRVFTKSGSVLSRTKGTYRNDASYYNFYIYPNLKIEYKPYSSAVHNSVGYDNNFIYYKIISNWLNNTVNIPNNDKLINGKFCQNNYYEKCSGCTEIFYPNLDFKCDNNLTINASRKYSGENMIINSKYGYMSYGDMLKAGYAYNVIVENSDTFINNKKNIISSTLVNRYSTGYKGSTSSEYYYILSNGGIISDYTESHTNTSCNGCRDDVYNDNNVFMYKKHRGKESSLKLYYVKPVINLSANIEIIGSGTKEDPYTLIN